MMRRGRGVISAREGSCAQAALEDRSGGTLLLQLAKKGPRPGAHHVPPPGCAGSSRPRAQPQGLVRRFNHRLVFRQSLNVGAERGPAPSPCTLHSKLLICAAEASKIKCLFGKF